MNEKGDFTVEKQKITNEIAKSVYGTTPKKDVRMTSLVQELYSRGAKDHLLMFLSGKAGSGKAMGSKLH